MQNTAAALADEDTPMMSGLASELRSTLWKMCPAMPKAKPANTAQSIRGQRSVPMV